MTQGSRGAYILYIYTQQGVNIHKVYSRFVSQQLYTYAHGKVAKIKYIYVQYVHTLLFANRVFF